MVNVGKHISYMDPMEVTNGIKWGPYTINGLFKKSVTRGSKETTYTWMPQEVRKWLVNGL